MANHFVTPSGSGSGSGADWSNAFAQGIISAGTNMNAGDVVYLSGGTYNGIAFKGGSSGNNVTYRRATAADHGTSTGWNAGYDSLVNITSGCSLAAYATLDGNLWTPPGLPTAWGIKVQATLGSKGIDAVAGYNIIRNVEVKGVGFTQTTTETDLIFWGAYSLISGCSLHDSDTFMKEWDYPSHGIMEYSYFYNNSGAPGIHMDVNYCSSGWNNCIFRWNVMWNCVSESIFFDNHYFSPTPSYWYGNLFVQGDSQGYGCCPIEFQTNVPAGQPYGPLYICNNTWVDWYKSNNLGGKSGGAPSSTMDTTNGVVKNNLYVNANHEWNPGNCSYNGYLNCVNTRTANVTGSETNKIIGSVSPFDTSFANKWVSGSGTIPATRVYADGSNIPGYFPGPYVPAFYLSATSWAKGKGTATVPSSWDGIPVNMDMFGNTGTDLGAFQSTSSPVYSIPNRPTTLNASQISSSEIDLTWTASTLSTGGAPVSTLVYVIQRYAGTGTPNWVTIATTAPAINTYADSGLSATTQYNYQVFAQDPSGQLSTASNTDFVITPLPTLPNAPTALNASTVSVSQIKVTWTLPTLSTGGVPVAQLVYVIQRYVGTGAPAWANLVTTSANATSYTDTGLTSGTQYNYQVFSKDTSNQLSASPSNTSSATTGSRPAIPNPPTGLSVIAISSSEIDLTWTASTLSAGGSPVSTLVYLVQSYAGTGATNWSTIFTTLAAVTSYKNTSLSGSTQYNYRVIAQDPSGQNSTPSNTASTSTLTQVGGTPTMVQHLSTSSNRNVPDYVSNTLEPGGPAYYLFIPNFTLGQNALILNFSFPTTLTNQGNPPTAGGASSVVSVTDDKGNAWLQQAYITRNGFNTASYVALNVAAGTHKITVTFNGTMWAFQACFTEFYNVTSVDVVGRSITTSAPNVNSGPMTLSGSNELVYTYGFDTNVSNSITSIAAGAGFTLLSADVYLGTFAQYSVNGSGTMTPSATITGSSDAFNVISLSLSSAAQGTAPGTGIRIVRINHVNYNRPIPTIFPCTGNLLVVVTAFGQANVNIYGVMTDSNGNAYAYQTDGSEKSNGIYPQMYYAANATPSTNLKITSPGANVYPQEVTFLMYDITGAAASPFDTWAFGAAHNTTNTTLTLPAIVPSSSNGLIITAMGNYYGPAINLNGVGQMFDTITYQNQVDADNMDNADGYGHYYNPSASSVSFIWAMLSADAGGINPLTVNVDGTPGAPSHALALAFKGSTTGTTAPNAPTALSATVISSSEIDLTWTPSTLSSGGAPVSTLVYLVQSYSGTGAANWSTIYTTPAGPVSPSYKHTGLTSSTVYNYRVIAQDPILNQSAPTSVASVTTLASGGSATPAFIQANSAVPPGVSTVTVSYLSPQTLGNTNVVIVGFSDPTNTQTITSVKDSSNNTYSVAAPLTRGSGLSQAIYVCANVVSGANSVTVVFSSTPLYPDIRIAEYSNISNAASIVDAAASGTGTGTAMSSGTLSTTLANDIVIAGATVTSLTISAGAGFTSRVITSPNGSIIEDRLAISPGSYTGTANQDISASWVMQAIALKALPVSTNIGWSEYEILSAKSTLQPTFTLGAVGTSWVAGVGAWYAVTSMVRPYAILSSSSSTVISVSIRLKFSCSSSASSGTTLAIGPNPNPLVSSSRIGMVARNVVRPSFGVSGDAISSSTSSTASSKMFRIRSVIQSLSSGIYLKRILCRSNPASASSSVSLISPEFMSRPTLFNVITSGSTVVAQIEETMRPKTASFTASVVNAASHATARTRVSCISNSSLAANAEVIKRSIISVSSVSSLSAPVVVVENANAGSVSIVGTNQKALYHPFPHSVSASASAVAIKAIEETVSAISSSSTSYGSAHKQLRITTSASTLSNAYVTPVGSRIRVLLNAVTNSASAVAMREGPAINPFSSSTATSTTSRYKRAVATATSSSASLSITTVGAVTSVTSASLSAYSSRKINRPSPVIVSASSMNNKVDITARINGVSASSSISNITDHAQLRAVTKAATLSSSFVINEIGSNIRPVPRGVSSSSASVQIKMRALINAISSSNALTSPARDLHAAIASVSVASVNVTATILRPKPSLSALSSVMAEAGVNARSVAGSTSNAATRVTIRPAIVPTSNTASVSLPRPCQRKTATIISSSSEIVIPGIVPAILPVSRSGGLIQPVIVVRIRVQSVSVSSGASKVEKLSRPSPISVSSSNSYDNLKSIERQVIKTVWLTSGNVRATTGATVRLFPRALSTSSTNMLMVIRFLVPIKCGSSSNVFTGVVEIAKAASTCIAGISSRMVLRTKAITVSSSTSVITFREVYHTHSTSLSSSSGTASSRGYARYFPHCLSASACHVALYQPVRPMPSVLAITAGSCVDTNIFRMRVNIKASSGTVSAMKVTLPAHVRSLSMSSQLAELFPVIESYATLATGSNATAQIEMSYAILAAYYPSGNSFSEATISIRNMSEYTGGPINQSELEVVTVADEQGE